MRKIGSLILLVGVAYLAYWWGDRFGFPTYLNVIVGIVLGGLCYFIIGLGGPSQ